MICSAVGFGFIMSGALTGPWRRIGVTAPTSHNGNAGDPAGCGDDRIDVGVILVPAGSPQPSVAARNQRRIAARS